MSRGRTEDWLDTVYGVRAIRGVYGEERPRLDGSRLVSVATNNPGLPELALGVALPDFPSEPPRKYVGNNTIHIILRFSNVAEMTWAGVIDAEPGEFDLLQVAAGIRLTYRNGSARLAVTAELATVADITSYIFDPLAPKI